MLHHSSKTAIFELSLLPVDYFTIVHAIGPFKRLQAINGLIDCGVIGPLHTRGEMRGDMSGYAAEP